MLAAVHDQAVCPAVNVETRVAADLVGDGLKANLVPDLQADKKKKKMERASLTRLLLTFF